MNEKEYFTAINQLQNLLLSCSAILGDNDFMENAEKVHGFKLGKKPSKNYKSGFYYVVRYKDDKTNQWLNTYTSTNTDDEIKAKNFAITNKEKIINNYYIHTEKLHQKTDGKEFYKMLLEYYIADSIYLKDDYANGKKIIEKKSRIEFNGVIKTFFIPYFKENNINSIQEITKSVYSNLKIYLQEAKNIKGKKLATKSITNYLMILNRILQYHLRNDKIIKLPYDKGGGIIHTTDEESKKPDIIPNKNLKGIFQIPIEKKDGRENTLLCYMLSLLGLTTGMRDSEIGRIKRSDILYSKNGNYHFLKAYNHKTAHHNKKETDKYRKIPLHPFVVEKLKEYIDEKKTGKDDYLFGVSKLNEDTKKYDGYLHQSKTHRAIVWLYKEIKFREYVNENGLNFKNLKLDTEMTEKEMSKKRIVFYSLRHTFITLCGLYSKNDNGIISKGDMTDYFTGHNSGSKMRANYTHMNSVDDKTFYDNYGHFVIDMLDKFIFKSEEEEKKLEDYIGKFINKKLEENKKLLDEDRNIEKEKFEENILTPLVDTLRPKKQEPANEDNYFESV
jgi:integrase